MPEKMAKALNMHSTIMYVVGCDRMCDVGWVMEHSLLPHSNDTPFLAPPAERQRSFSKPSCPSSSSTFDLKSLFLRNCLITFSSLAWSFISSANRMAAELF